ncbi:MAG: hypothetical protein IJA67_00645 [Oscillospiraceae bacterium]|nr:hypothetical protein [Oscillospiraceae bacterium]
MDRTIEADDIRPYDGGGFRCGGVDTRKGRPYEDGRYTYHPVGAAISCPQLRSWIEQLRRMISAPTREVYLGAVVWTPASGVPTREGGYTYHPVGSVVPDAPWRSG